MPSALVHIGLHKTGSTYLQMICFRNGSALREAGIRFIGGVPRESVRQSRKKIDQHGISEREALWEPTELRTAIAKTQADKHLLISCESLEALGRWPRSMADLHATLAARCERVTYFVVVRHVVDHAASEMQQIVKAFQTKDLIRRHFYLEHGRPLQERLSSFFEGDYPLVVADFDTFVKGDTPSQLAQLLSEHLGARPPVLDDHKESNESIGAMGVAFMLAINNLTREALGSRLPKLVDWQHFKSVQVHTRDAIRNKLGPAIRFMPFTEEEQLDVIRRGREANAAFIERFPGPWVESVFSERVRPYSVVLLSELDEPEKARVNALLLETWSLIEPLLRKEFTLQDGFDPRAALDRYLAREREIMFRTKPARRAKGAKKAAREARRESREARRESRKALRREQRAARRASAQAAATTAAPTAAAPSKAARRAERQNRKAGRALATAPREASSKQDQAPERPVKRFLGLLARTFGKGKP